MSWTYLITGNTTQKLKMLFKLNAVRVHRGFEKQRKGATSVLLRYIRNYDSEESLGAVPDQRRNVITETIW